MADKGLIESTCFNLNNKLCKPLDRNGLLLTDLGPNNDDIHTDRNMCNHCFGSGDFKTGILCKIPEKLTKHNVSNFNEQLGKREQI